MRTAVLKNEQQRHTAFHRYPRLFAFMPLDEASPASARSMTSVRADSGVEGAASM